MDISVDRIRGGHGSMENRKISKKRIALRVLALAVALVLAGGVYLTTQARIRFSRLNYVGQVAEYAANLTADETDYLTRGRLDRAWRILKTTIRKPKTYDDYELYASIAIAREDYGNAAKYLEGCIDTYDKPGVRDLAVLQLRLASLYVLQGNYADALTRLDEAVRTDPELAAAYFLRAQMHMALDDTDAAVADMRTYQDLPGSDPLILASLGGLYESCGEYTRAIDCYTMGIENKETYDVELYKDRARCRILSEDIRGAKQDLDTYFGLDGRDEKGEAAALLAMCRMDAQDYAGAYEMFHRAVEDGYETPYLLYSQATLCAYLAEDYSGAAMDGLEAIRGMDEAGENSGEVHYWVALAYLIQENYGLCRTHLEQAQRLQPQMSDIPYYMGVCAMAQGENEDAIGYFTESLEKGENTEMSLYDRAVCLLQEGLLEEAAADLTQLKAQTKDAELTAQADELLDVIAQVQAL